MRVGGRPAEFHYFFELDGTMVVHRLAFDPALARYSPGLVATLETLRVASEDGMTRVEFLGGNERYSGFVESRECEMVREQASATE